MKKQVTKKIWMALVIGAVVVGALGWFLFGESIQERLNRRQFDSAEWKSPKSKINNIRIRMVDDLLSRNNFKGMTVEQVTAIIGEPQETEYFKEWDMVYWLGPERGFMSIDSEWLVMRLNGQKRISDVRIVTD